MTIALMIVMIIGAAAAFIQAAILAYAFPKALAAVRRGQRGKRHWQIRLALAIARRLAFSLLILALIVWLWRAP